MTEDIFGELKRRFPFINNIRVHLYHAIDIIATTAILHNIAKDWADPMPEDDHPDGHQILERPQPPVDVVIHNALNHAERRARAIAQRDIYREEFYIQVSFSWQKII